MRLDETFALSSLAERKAKTITTIMLALFLLSLVMMAVPVSGHSGVSFSAWTWTPPTIDGNIDTAVEWAGAATASFASTGDLEGIFYVMNDDSNLYIAVRTTDPTLSQDTTGTDAVWIYFDNNNDGAGPEVGDDIIGWNGLSSEGFRDGYSDGTYVWRRDADAGGDSDGSAAATNDGAYNYFEISHPLDTTDNAHDFSLSIGDTVGFTIRFTVDGFDKGFWPTSDPAEWHDIHVASSIYQGDLILTDNNVTTIEGRFDINGSIIVEENATLILKSAIINFTQTENWQFGMILRNPANGNPRLQATKTTITSNYKFSINFYQNSSATIHDSRITAPPGYYCWLWTYDSSVASFYNLTIHAVSSAGDSNISVFESTMNTMNTYGSSTVSLYNSTVHSVTSYLTSGLSVGESKITRVRTYDSSQVEMDYCKLGSLYAENSSTVRISGLLEINGNITVEGNAELTLEDAIVNFTQTHDEECNVIFGKTTDGLPKLRVTNTTITSNYVFILYFYGNSSATVNQLNMPDTLARLYAFDFSVLDLNAFISRYLRAFNSSIINLSNSAPFYLRSYGTSAFNISNSTIRKQYALDSSVVTVSRSNYTVDLRGYDSSLLHTSDSTINSLYTYDESTVWLVNSTYSDCGIQDQSGVYVCWYLDVHVIDEISQDVPSANVTAYYQNGTIADSQLADSQGRARFTLTEKMMNATREYPIGNYTITASYETHTGQESVNMTGNKEITISLPFIIPELPTILLLPILIIITTITAILTKRRSRKPYHLEIANSE